MHDSTSNLCIIISQTQADFKMSSSGHVILPCYSLENALRLHKGTRLSKELTNIASEITQTVEQRVLQIINASSTTS